MKLLEKILVPVQFEKSAEEHVILAGKLAQRFNSELLLLHVLPDEAKSDSIKDMITRSVKNEFKGIKNNLSDMGLEIREILRYGNTFDQIMDTAEEENVNVIIVGNNEPKSNNNFKISILAEKLIRKAEKPVWVHRDGKSLEPDSIMCPVDFSDASERALNNAIKIARMLGSNLHIVHVLEPLTAQYSPRLKVDYSELEKNRDAESKEQFDKFLAEFNFSGIKHEITWLKGDAFERITEYIKKQHIELMIMGATGKTILSRIFLGSLTEQIARKMPCSLVTTKAENILNLKIDYEITNIEKHFANAQKLIENGFFEEAEQQLKLCIQINDLHIPSLSALIKLYGKLGKKDQEKKYKQKLDDILRRLWDKKIEFEIRKHYNLSK